MEPRTRAAEAVNDGSGAPSAAAPARPRATSPLRMVGYVASLALLAFLQQPGRIVADTKIDLVIAPWQFLERAVFAWEPLGSFGQLQNQAYGYLFPMGPFFVLGDLVALPSWVVQRLWWTLLLALAFVGVVRLCRELRIGTPWTHVVAAYAFVLSPRIASLLGASSVEIWPTALLPWVLIPLVRASHRGSVVRGAAAAALVVACCGGVNATAVSAVLPLGVIWILTRSPGPRRWRLLGWWTFFTLLATAWWLVPLLVLGAYSAPFLDYIENATLTGTPTDPTRSLLGVSNWVVYADPSTYAAGDLLATTPFLLADAAAIAGLGLVGILLGRNPHQRFLVLGLLTGLVLVGLGYAGELSGWFAGERQELLDGILSPLRNTHKYDGIVRLVLVLGLAHALTVVPGWLTETLGPRARVAGHAMIAIVLVGMLAPWTSSVVGTHGFVGVPSFWKQAADYLDRTGTRSPALVLPAGEFGYYLWGATRDDVLQPLTSTPWVSRTVIPLAQPGNVTMLDGITALLEGGGPPEELAALLEESGIGHVVLRHDLDRGRVGSPEPDLVRQRLLATPGLRPVAAFGPMSPDDEEQDASGDRVITGGGSAAAHPTIEVFRVTGARPPAVLVDEDDVTVVAGSPGVVPSTLSDGGAGVRMHPPDAGEFDELVVTDALRRREKSFQAVRWNDSATLPRSWDAAGSGAEFFHRMSEDDERWQTVEVWDGIAGVSASSSQGWYGAFTPLDRSAHPGAALDEDDATAWRSARGMPIDEQWWEVDFGRPRDVSSLSVTLGLDSVEVGSLRITAGDEEEVVDAPSPGETSRYTLGWSSVTRLRIAPVDGEEVRGGAVTLAEVDVPGLSARRLLELPAPPEGVAATRVEVSRDRGRPTCLERGEALVCRSGSGLQGEDGDTLSRRFDLAVADAYDVRAQASLRRHPDTADLLAEVLGIRIEAPGTAAEDVAQTAWAMADGDEGTTWVGPRKDPSVELRLPEPIRWDQVQLVVDPNAAVARPTRVRVWAGTREVLSAVGDDGIVELPGWTSRSIRIDVVGVERTLVESGGVRSRPGPGISELRVNGESLVSTLDLPCGRGPVLEVGPDVVATAVTHELAGLLRGEAAQLRTCVDGEEAPSTVALPGGQHDLRVEPTSLLRAERVELDAGGQATPSVAQVSTVDLDFDDRQVPASAQVRADQDSLLVLAQNFNRGWEARAAGDVLEPVRVNGWQQAWRVPAGTDTTVRLTYGPEATYRGGLIAGSGLALIVVAVVLLGGLRRFRSRRPALPALGTGPVGYGDAVLTVALIGLLLGWTGVLVASAVALAATRYAVRTWAPGGAALAVLVAAAPLVATEGRLTDWGQLLGQASMSLALSLTVICLLANGPAFFRRMK